MTPRPKITHLPSAAPARPLRILSLGAGVQSTTILLMVLLGEIEPIDAAIFADTGCEPRAVYKHLTWLINYADEHGVAVHIVGKKNLVERALDYRRSAKGNLYRPVSLPYYCQSSDGHIGIPSPGPTRRSGTPASPT